jgi:hypothetical protein
MNDACIESLNKLTSLMQSVRDGDVSLSAEELECVLKFANAVDTISYFVGKLSDDIDWFFFEREANKL